MLTFVLNRIAKRAVAGSLIVVGCGMAGPRSLQAQPVHPAVEGDVSSNVATPAETSMDSVLGYDLRSGQIAPMPAPETDRIAAVGGPASPPNVAFAAAAFDLLEILEGGDRGTVDHVIGADDRRWVSQTTDTPYRAVVHLELFTRTGAPAGSCSGSLVRPQIVLTAGHCVYSSQFGGFVGNVRVTPGRSGSAAPFGWQAADWVYASESWQATQSFDYDWAVVHLPDRSLSNRVASYYYPVAFDYGAGTPLTITGFPGDLEDRYGAAYMWTATSRVTYVPAGGGQFHTDADAMPGNSGGPCWFVGRTQSGLIPAQIGIVSNQQFYDAARRNPYNACATVPAGLIDWIYGQP